MSVPMASTKIYINELFGTLLVLSALLSTASAVDCYGKSFHCINSTHFMICVDLGGGVSQAIDDFYIACPAPTVCHETNHFECEFPAPTTTATIRSNVISETTLPWEEIITFSSLDKTTKEFSENYINTERTTTVEYSITTDTTVDVTKKTATNFYTNNELNVTEISPTIVADITTSPIETVSQAISEDRSITEITLTAKGVPTNVIEPVVHKTSTQNTDTVNQDIVTTEAIPSSNVQLVTTQAPSSTQSSANTMTVDGQYTIETVENVPTSEHPTIYEQDDSTHYIEIVNLDIVTTEAVGIPFSNSDVQLVTIQASSLTQNSADTTTADGAYTIETVENTPSSEHPTTIYEENFTKDTTQKIETVNLDIVTTEAINIPVSNSDVQLVTTQAPSITQSSADTTPDGAFTIGTVENAPGSEQPTTVNEEKFTKDSTQNIETVNVDIITTEATNIPFSNSDDQLVMTQAPSLTQSSADTTTLDGAYTIETVENAPSSEHPTTIYEEIFTKDTTKRIETVNLDIVTTEAINIPVSNSDVQLVTTQAPSINTQSSADTTLDGAFTIETVENAPGSEQPTTVNEEKLTKDSTQNIETVNVDIVTTEAMNKPFSNSDDQLVMTQAPSITQSSADTTTLGGAFIIETVDNAPSSEQQTTVNEEKITKYSTQNIETVNVDIVTTDAVNIPFSNSDYQLVMTQAPFLTQSSADTTTLGGAFIIETVENAPSSDQPTKVNKENVTKDSTQNIQIVNVDIVTTEAVDIPFSNSNVQLGTTQLTFTQSSADTNLDRVFTTETVENNFITEQPTMINEQSLTIDTTQNIVTENMIIPNSKAINRDIIHIATTETIYESSTMINDKSVMTEESHVTKTTVELHTSTEQTTMLHEENRTAGTSENDASLKVPIAIGNNESVTLKTQNPEYVKQGVTIIAEIIENGAITEPPITTNEKSSITGTIQNVATEYNIIPTRHSVNFDITTEVVYTPTTIMNDHIIQVASEDYISTKPQLLTDTTVDRTKVDEAFTTRVVGNGNGTKQTNLINKESVAMDTTRNIDSIILPASQDHTATETINVTTIISDAQPAFENNIKTEGLLPPSENIAFTPELNNGVDFITAKPINIEQIIAKLPDNKHVPNAELEMAIVRTTNNNYANADHDNDDSRQNSKTEFLGPKSESNDISNQNYNSQNGEIETIRVANHAQYSKLQPSIVGQDQTANTNWNPFDNYLIDKSNQNPVLTRKSEVTYLKIERNDVNVVSSDTEFVSQQHVISALPASNPIPAEINNRKQSYNATTVIQSSDGFLATNGLQENIINANSEPEVASLPTPGPVTQVEEHSTYLKTNTFASSESVTLSSSKTVPTIAKVTDTTILNNKHYVETIPNLFGPGSESTVDETGSNVREIGSNSNVFSDKKESVNPNYSKDATVIDTKILDNTHNIEIIHNLFSPVSESTIDQTGSNVREIGSNANVSSDKKELANPQNSKDATIADTTILDNTHITETTHTLFSPGLESIVDEINSNVREIGGNVNVFSDNTELEHPKNTDVTVVDTKILENTHNEIVPIFFSPGLESSVDDTGSKVREIESEVTNIPLLTDVTSKTQNENIVLTAESYQSATFYPTLVNTPIQVNVNGVHNTNTPAIKNPKVLNVIIDNLHLPTNLLDIQAEVTDKNISSKNPTFGGLTTVENTKNKMFNKNNDITTNSTFPDANSPTGVSNRADVSPTHPLQVGQVSIGQTNTPINVHTISPNEQNVNETNSAQTSNVNENESQKNNSPINLSLSISTQKLSQSVTPNPISPVTKQVEVAIPFTCVNGIRGRYSDKDDCRKFYICVGNNQPVVGNCPENTVFSEIKKLCTKNLSHCIRQNEFKCPSAGRFSDFIKDNVYYICVSHKDHLYRFKFQCQKGYIFNKTTVKCIESKEIESNESVSISSSDNSSQTGSTSTASSSINNNRVSTSSISNNSSSDDSSSKTDDVSMTTKNNEAEETPEKSEGNEDDEEDEVFKCKKEGKFPIRDECRRFYLCKKKRKSEYRRKIKKCGSGRVFHKDKKKCVDADSYEC